MYDIRQFKPSLYALVMLGITGFGLAAQAPGVWVLAMGAILAHAWLSHTNRFRPMPRWIANIVTVLCVLLLLSAVGAGGTTPILLVGYFLVMLQVVKYYELRANRDYAQLFVLSLLLMVAAAISTASLLFGILFISYLFLALYCCLLFHLKVETDHARQAIGVPEERLNPNTLRQDQRYLSQSMRRLTAFVSLFAITIAVLTFLLFPRGSGAGLLAPMQWKPSQTLTGFSDSVSFQNVARITQNNHPVAWVKLTRDGAPYHTASPLLLRGVTLDRYTGNGEASGAGAYQWVRTITESWVDDFNADQLKILTSTPASNEITQSITLQATGTNVLFALGGLASFKPNESGRFRFSKTDEVLQAVDPIIQSIRYQVVSRDEASPDRPTGQAYIAKASHYPDRASAIDPRIHEFALRPEVSGSDVRGPLARRRGVEEVFTPLDATIAQHIEDYLRSNYAYTLDLTDASRIEGQDPMVAFLYDFKRGHCEYFAGAMALMCQSLGMQARVVVGFKCDDYNSLGDYYVVRESHAHAWVEVLDDQGRWQTYDPPAAAEAAAPSQHGLWQRVRSLFSFLEYTWANSVVAYDRESRSNLIDNVNNNLVNSSMQGGHAVSTAREWLSMQRSVISSNVIVVLIVLMVVALISSVGWFVFEKWKLRRRAKRIGLQTLPASEQVKLARQLGFYDDLVRLLERHRIFRPPQLTPLEFSDLLTFLPVDTYDAVRRLTEAFYRVRYGRAELSAAQRRHLATVLDQVEHSLGR